MDLRVLAAVFLTLFAIAIGMAQGDLEMQELRDTAAGLKDTGGISDFLTQAGTSASNTTITGSITSEAETTLDVHSRTRLEMTIGPSTTIHTGDSTLTPSENSSLVVDGFQGTVRISPHSLVVDGTVHNLSTPSFDFSYSTPTDFRLTADRSQIAFDGLERQAITVANATGTVTAGETTVQVEREEARFRGFTGDMSVTGTQYELEGAIRSAAVGGAEIG